MISMTQEQDSQFLEQCIDRAVASVATGGGPFAAAVVRDGRILAQADNRVTTINDPTAHAEVAAIREAGRLAGKPHLPDCVLYTSCEPCPMCLAAAMWARIPRVVYAAPHSEALRAGFADTAIAQRLYGQSRPASLEAGYLQHCELPRAGEPFDAWLANTERVEY